MGQNGNRKMAALCDNLPTRKNIKINPAGEWNKVKIVSNKNRVEHWLNDKGVIVYTRNSDSYKELVRLSKYNKLENFVGQKQGHILFRDMGMKFPFKILRLLPGNI